MTQPLSRAIRGGFTVHLGILTFTAKLHSVVTESEDGPLVRLCAGGDEEHPPSRIRRTEACPVCENSDVGRYVKGRPEGDSFLVLSDDEVGEIEQIKGQYKDNLNLKVHPAEQLDRAPLGGRQYYLNVSSSGGSKAYALIASLVERRSDVAFVGEFAVKGSPAVFRLLSQGGVLILQELARPEQVREAPQVDGTFADSELELAARLVDALTTPYVPAEYADKAAIKASELLDGRTPVAGGVGADASIESLLQGELKRLSARTPRKRAARKTAETAA